MDIFSRKGFTLVEIIITVAVIAILLAIALPNYIKTRATSKKTICINNLKQIDAAIDRWAMENNIPEGTMPGDEIDNYLKNGVQPTCPAGGTYTLYAVGSKPQITCSLEADGHKLPE